MTVNPYQSPLAEQTDHRPNDIPGLIRYREFRATYLSFVLSGRKQMERLRSEAEAFINAEIGVGNVVSIAEHTGLEYSIAVWYRTVPSAAAVSG